MKIAVFSSCNYDQYFLQKANTGHTLSFFPHALSGLSLPQNGDYDAVCLFVNDQVDARMMEKLRQCGIKLILLRCAGFNSIDLEAAAETGIKILRVPGYSPHAVAEHAMTLILTLNRKTHKAYNRTREGNFSIEGLMGFNLNQAKVAIIGTGSIGKAFYQLIRGFGCQVKAYDPYPDEALKSKGLHYGTLAEVLEDADIVSLHCPLTTHNHHMINATTLKLFKPGTMLINTSRGGLVDTSAVIQALKSGQLGALGIDVYEKESKLFFADHSAEIIGDEMITRLLSFPNVLVTAHQAFFTKEAMEEIASITFSNADAFSQGLPLKNEIFA